MAGNSKGFTLIELMIVVLIIGILAAISIPNFMNLHVHAKEGNVKANMHTLQMALEDYAAVHDGIYPTNAEKGEVKALAPGGVWPRNPFTSVRLADAEVSFGSDPDAPGEIGANPATVNGYQIKGYGKSALLSLVLSNGF